MERERRGDGSRQDGACSLRVLARVLDASEPALELLHIKFTRKLVNSLLSLGEVLDASEPALELLAPLAGRGPRRS